MHLIVVPQVKGSIRAASCIVGILNGIIIAIRKHIVSQKTLPRGCEGVRIDKAADGGVVITALEVIESGFLIVYISTIAQGVLRKNGVAGLENNVTVGIILVNTVSRARGTGDADDIALQVQKIITGVTIILQRVGCALFIIEEVHDVGSATLRPGLTQQLAAGIDVVIGNAIYGLTGADTIAVVGVANRSAGFRCACQFPAILPGKGPAGTVIVACRIAAVVIGDGFSIKRGQQIHPAVGITIDIGMVTGLVLGGEKISCRIVGIRIRNIVYGCIGQLTLRIIGVCLIIEHTSGSHRFDIAILVISILQIKRCETASASIGNLIYQIGSRLVGIGTSTNGILTGSQALKTVIVISQIGKRTIAGICEQSLVIISISDLVLAVNQIDVLFGQAVTVIILLPGLQFQGTAVVSTAADQTAQAVVQIVKDRGTVLCLGKDGGTVIMFLGNTHLIS